MNEYQTIFTLFYALYSAVFVSITGKLHPFDTPAMFKGYPKAWLRFCVSMLFINLLPISCFACIYSILGKAENCAVTLPITILLFAPSLVGQGIYRIYYGVMLLGNKKSKSKINYWFYDKELYKKDKDVKKELQGLPEPLVKDLQTKPQPHKDSLPHIVPGFIWVCISLLPVLYFIKCTN